MELSNMKIDPTEPAGALEPTAGNPNITLLDGDICEYLSRFGSYSSLPPLFAELQQVEDNPPSEDGVGAESVSPQPSEPRVAIAGDQREKFEPATPGGENRETDEPAAKVGRVNGEKGRLGNEMNVL